MAWHWIIDDPKLLMAEKMVLLTITRNQRGNAPARISLARIAALMGVKSVRCVTKALAAIEAKGYRVVVESGKGRHRFNLYRVRQEQGILFSNANVLVDTAEKMERSSSFFARKTGKQELRSTISMEKRNYVPTSSEESPKNLKAAPPAPQRGEFKKRSGFQKASRRLSYAQMSARVGTGPETGTVVVRPGVLERDQARRAVRNG